MANKINSAKPRVGESSRQFKAGSPFPPEVECIIEEVADIAGYLWDRHWAERNAGNISMDVTEVIGRRTQAPKKAAWIERSLPFPELGGSWLLITSAGSRMRDLARRPEEFLGIIRIADNLDGYHLVGGPEKGFTPTSELLSHLRIHQSLRKRGAVERAILHTHPDALIAMTHIPEFKDETRLNSVLWGMHPEAILVVPSGAGFVPYALTGTIELATATVEALASHAVAIWEKHGCFAIGPTPSDAFDAIDMLEKSARIFLMVKSAGRSPEGLNREQIEELQRKFSQT
jgi:rhamnulose-1-phosphate aldolase